jgi:hypothetical protein
VLTIGFRDVREKHVPNLDDEFARDSGEADSLEALRAKYADSVREEDQNEAERDARKRLVEALLERNNFEVAPSLVAREVAAQVDLFKRQLQQQGIKLSQTGMSEQQVASQMRPQALFNVKAFLLLDAIGKAEGIVVDEAEVDKELQSLAEEQGQNVDRLRATMEKNNQLLLLRAQIREEKILDFLMGKAVVTEEADPAPEARPPKPAAIRQRVAASHRRRCHRRDRDRNLSATREPLPTTAQRAGSPAGRCAEVFCRLVTVDGPGADRSVRGASLARRRGHASRSQAGGTRGRSQAERVITVRSPCERTRVRAPPDRLHRLVSLSAACDLARSAPLASPGAPVTIAIGTTTT